MKALPPYSFGIGDRFAQQGKAQLQAFLEASRLGIQVTPVWNKSHREHGIVKTVPSSVREEADAAVASLGWNKPYFVDADHINIGNVEGFLAASDFFTIDVADSIGRPPELASAADFMAACKRFPKQLMVPGMAAPLSLNREVIESAVSKFLAPMQEAGRVYRLIAESKRGEFVAEVSVDETNEPQSPAHLLLILFMLAREEVPCQTIAPKFTGRFNKGVDYVGDIARFEREFEDNLGVLSFAIREFGMPANLKLSVHSGSDKFSLYPAINRLIKKHDAGLHVKTAGTTWLEEVAGLAEADGDGLEVARKIYLGARARFSELVKPYASVVDIDSDRLPEIDEVASWTSGQFVSALRHDRSCPACNSDFRQLMHVSFKIAAEMKDIYLAAVRTNEHIIGPNITHNLLRRHIQPIFGS